MNKHRSPLSGTNTSYFIGIILLGIMFPILPFIIYNNSKVETVNEQETTTESTTEFITTEEIVIEEITTEDNDISFDDIKTTYCYYPIDVIHAIESNQKSDDNEEEVKSREEETKELVADSVTNVSTPVATTSVIYEATSSDAPSETEEETISIEVSVTEEVEDDVITETSEEYTYYATYQLTAYCATGNPCADGVYPSVGYTVASNDPNLWHKWIYIDGWGTYYVHDTGGMASNVIDIFMGSYDECIQFGRRTADIYVYN